MSSKIRKSFNTALLIGQFAASMLPGADAVVLLGKLAKGKDVSFGDVFLAATSFIPGGGSGKIVGKVFGAFASGKAAKTLKHIWKTGKPPKGLQGWKDIPERRSQWWPSPPEGGCSGQSHFL